MTSDPKKCVARKKTSKHLLVKQVESASSVEIRPAKSGPVFNTPSSVLSPDSDAMPEEGKKDQTSTSTTTTDSKKKPAVRSNSTPGIKGRRKFPNIFSFFRRRTGTTPRSVEVPDSSAATATSHEASRSPTSKVAMRPRESRPAKREDRRKDDGKKADQLAPPMVKRSSKAPAPRGELRSAPKLGKAAEPKPLGRLDPELVAKIGAISLKTPTERSRHKSFAGFVSARETYNVDSPAVRVFPASVMEPLSEPAVGGEPGDNALLTARRPRQRKRKPSKSGMTVSTEIDRDREALKSMREATVVFDSGIDGGQPATDETRKPDEKKDHEPHAFAKPLRKSSSRKLPIYEEMKHVSKPRAVGHRHGQQGNLTEVFNQRRLNEEAQAKAQETHKHTPSEQETDIGVSTEAQATASKAAPGPSSATDDTKVSCAKADEKVKPVGAGSFASEKFLTSDASNFKVPVDSLDSHVNYLTASRSRRSLTSDQSDIDKEKRAKAEKNGSKSKKLGQVNRRSPSSKPNFAKLSKLADSKTVPEINKQGTSKPTKSACQVKETGLKPKYREFEMVKLRTTEREGEYPEKQQKEPEKTKPKKREREEPPEKQKFILVEPDNKLKASEPVETQLERRNSGHRELVKTTAKKPMQEGPQPQPEKQDPVHRKLEKIKQRKPEPEDELPERRTSKHADLEGGKLKKKAWQDGQTESKGLRYEELEKMKPKEPELEEGQVGGRFFRHGELRQVELKNAEQQEPPEKQNTEFEKIKLKKSEREIQPEKRVHGHLELEQVKLRKSEPQKEPKEQKSLYRELDNIKLKRPPPDDEDLETESRLSRKPELEQTKITKLRPGEPSERQKFASGEPKKIKLEELRQETQSGKQTAKPTELEAVKLKKPELHEETEGEKRMHGEPGKMKMKKQEHEFEKPESNPETTRKKPELQEQAEGEKRMHGDYGKIKLKKLGDEVQPESKPETFGKKPELQEQTQGEKRMHGELGKIKIKKQKEEVQPESKPETAGKKRELQEETAGEKRVHEEFGKIKMKKQEHELQPERRLSNHRGLNETNLKKPERQDEREQEKLRQGELGKIILKKGHEKGQHERQISRPGHFETIKLKNREQEESHDEKVQPVLLRKLEQEKWTEMEKLGAHEDVEEVKPKKLDEQRQPKNYEVETKPKRDDYPRRRRKSQESQRSSRITEQVTLFEKKSLEAIEPKTPVRTKIPRPLEPSIRERFDCPSDSYDAELDEPTTPRITASTEKAPKPTGEPLPKAKRRVADMAAVFNSLRESIE